FARKEAARRAAFESEMTRVIDEFSKESDRIVAGLRDKAAAIKLRKETDARKSELRRAAGARLLKHVDGPQREPTRSAARLGEPADQSAAPAALSPGSLAEAAVDIHERDRVLIRTLDRQGVVESISGDVFTVIVGSLRFRARRDELALLEAAKSDQH